MARALDRLIVAGLGHMRLQMTDRYLLREVMLSKEEVLRIQASVGEPPKS